MEASLHQNIQIHMILKKKLWHKNRVFRKQKTEFTVLIKRNYKKRKKMFLTELFVYFILLIIKKWAKTASHVQHFTQYCTCSYSDIANLCANIYLCYMEGGRYASVLNFTSKYLCLLSPSPNCKSIPSDFNLAQSIYTATHNLRNVFL